MNEHDRSNKLIWALAIVGLVSFGSVGLVWSTGGPLPSKARAEVPKAKVEVPSAAAVAGLEKRMGQLEAGMKAPPTFDSSQLEAQLKGLESKLTAVQTQLGTFKMSEFDALKTKIDSAGKANSESVKTTINALQTDVGNLNKRFDQLSQQVASATATDDHKQSSQKHSRSKSRD
jgi:outer membrane murein-binding lipoprotein Lpp